MTTKASTLVTQLLESPLAESWLQEFGPEYEVPAGLLLPGVRDTSWHNDACPSLTYDIGQEDVENEANNIKSVVWCEHPNPNLRETPGPRFRIEVYRNFDTELEVWSGDDPEEAVRTWRSVVDGQFFRDLVTEEKSVKS